MISLSSVIYRVTIYSSSYFLEILNKLKIKVISIEKVNNYEYLVEIPYKNKKNFEENFNSIILIKIKGLKAIINKLILYKFSVISLIISIVFFFYLSSLIFVIDIKGNSKYIDEQIALFLEEKEIKKYSSKPTLDALKELKNEFFFLHIDKLKSVEFYVSGNKLLVTYSLKDKEIILEGKHGKMYSSHDAIISKIQISSGNVLVKENNYVKKGDLLVDDYLYYKDEPIYVGTSGYIFAYTFETLELKGKYYDSDAETLSYLLNKARTTIYDSFTASDDKIDKEKILEYKCSKSENSSYLKVFYTNYRNIVKY